MSGCLCNKSVDSKMRLKLLIPVNVDLRLMASYHQQSELPPYAPMPKPSSDRWGYNFQSQIGLSHIGL